VLDIISDTLKDPKAQEAIAQVITQGIAFLLFFWILKLLAWKPIIRLLDQRREKISSEFQRVSQLEDKFNQLRKEYEDRLKDIDAEGRKRIQEAIGEGRQMASEIAQDAHRQARKITDKAKQNIELEVAKARAQLKEDVIRLTIAATEKILRERVDADKNRDLVSRFIEQLPSTNIADKGFLGQHQKE
jgi:F-type H+-transporting ATPase subunit b